VGSYSPSNADVTATAPVQYKNLTGGGGAASGWTVFRVFNRRADWDFVYFRNGTQWPVMAARSNAITFPSPDAPLQGRLSLEALPSRRVTLSWVSGAPPLQPRVKYGKQYGVSTDEVFASTVTYGRENMCGPPASTTGWREPGYIHKATLGELEPGVTYFYQFGDDLGAGGFSEIFNFTAPPPRGAKNMRIIAYGDMGTYADDGSLHPGTIRTEPPALNVTNRIVARDLAHSDLLLHFGDISYARGYSADWDLFGLQIAPIATRVPYVVGVGNHEWDYLTKRGIYPNITDSGGECGVSFMTRYGVQAYYSVEMGPAHVVFLSTEEDFGPGSPQHEWLTLDLSVVDRKTTPWLIVTGHRPMYIDSNFTGANNSDQDVALLLRNYVEPLLVQHKVDLGLWGHHHSYQRTCPVSQTQCGNSTLPVHIVVGTAGQTLSTNTVPVTPSYMQYVNVENYGYLTIDITAKTLTGSFVNTNGDVLDTFTLTHAEEAETAFGAEQLVR
jgi:hypothetical protein